MNETVPAYAYKECLMARYEANVRLIWERSGDIREDIIKLRKNLDALALSYLGERLEYPFDWSVDDEWEDV